MKWSCLLWLAVFRGRRRSSEPRRLWGRSADGSVNTRKFCVVPGTVCCLGLLVFPNAQSWAQEIPSGTPRPPAENRFEKDIRRFEARDAEHPPPRGAVLFIGSSSIRRWKSLKQDFEGIPVINRGFGGAEFGDVLHFLNRIVIPYRPRAIVIYAGSHDLHHNDARPKEVCKKFEAFCAAVHARLPDTKVCFLSMKPSRAKWKSIERDRTANRLIEAYARTAENVAFIDIWTPMVAESSPPPKRYFAADLNHPSREAYRLWAKTIRPFIEEPK